MSSYNIMSNIYDYIIIGGGLSGLTMCMNLPKNKKILCLENTITIWR